jgi:hypothetical protein
MSPNRGAQPRVYAGQDAGVIVSANQAQPPPPQRRGILQDASDVEPVQNINVTMGVKNELGTFSCDSSIEFSDYTCCESQLESVGLPQWT